MESYLFGWQKLKAVSFIVFLFCIQSLSSESVELQIIDNLDKPTSLNSSDGGNWYIINKKISPESIPSDAPEWEVFSKKGWRKYSAPQSAYIQNTDWENSEYLSIVKWMKFPKQFTAPHISIRLGIISDKDIVYFNGEKIGSHGDFSSKEPQGYDKIRIYKIPTGLIRLGEINSILIVNKPYFSYTSGIEQDKLSIGPGELIEGVYLRDEYIKIFLLMIYITVAFYFLFLFVRRRKEFENLFFGLFTISLVIYQFLRNQLKYDLGLEFTLLKKSEYLVLLTLVPLMYHFIRSYFRFSYHWVYKIADSILGVIFIIILFSSDITFYDFLNKNLIQPIWVFYMVASIYFLLNKSIKKDGDAILMLFGFVFLISAAILDVLSTRNVIVFPRVAGYAFMTLILSIATILANKFVRLHSEVEELNTNLEKKVEERTEELNNTLKEVNKLKVQQDGDYFLTSLLLNPLITNHNKSKFIDIDFFTKQKKSFEFKGKKHEIGGDISISSNLELKGKKYTVFINGDAMGKSMQGAGGALVLGVVFNAVLTRSNADFNKNKHPEIWIKETFIDLQRVFESFNGSMLISIVLGLVEEETGIMYYINAEHPWTVLYRDEKASFLENELVLRKLGFPGNEDSFFVKTFQLKDGDVLIAGSDGRDDILLGHDEYGNRIINENEEAFLDVVQKGKSNLTNIVSLLEKTGEYTDDITLLRIEYKPEPKETSENTDRPMYEKGKELALKGNYKEAIQILEEFLEKENQVSENTIILLAQSYFKIKEWEKSLDYFEKAIDERAFSTENLFYASYSAKMCKKYEKAKILGERCYLRDPSHSKNLLNLADIYKKLDDKARSLYLIERLLKLEPNNRNAIRLQEMIRSVN